MGKRPDKIPDSELVPFIREAVASGNYRERYHQRVENVGRPGHDVTRQEIEQVLLGGRREPARDRFEPYNTCGVTPCADERLTTATSGSPFQCMKGYCLSYRFTPPKGVGGSNLCGAKS